MFVNVQLTDRPPALNEKYPVVIFTHGDDYKLGDAQMYAGHILAKKEVVVITFNYRLGALGQSLAGIDGILWCRVGTGDSGWV